MGARVAASAIVAVRHPPRRRAGRCVKQRNQVLWARGPSQLVAWSRPISRLVGRCPWSENQSMRCAASEHLSPTLPDPPICLKRATIPPALRVLAALTLATLPCADCGT